MHQVIFSAFEQMHPVLLGVGCRKSFSFSCVLASEDLIHSSGGTRAEMKKKGLVLAPHLLKLSIISSQILGSAAAVDREFCTCEAALALQGCQRDCCLFTFSRSPEDCCHLYKTKRVLQPVKPWPTGRNAGSWPARGSLHSGSAQGKRRWLELLPGGCCVPYSPPLGHPGPTFVVEKLGTGLRHGYG